MNVRFSINLIFTCNKPNKRALSAIFMLGFFLFGFAQKVIVVDSLTKKTIPYVFVESKEKNVLTNEKGEINLSSFKNDDIVILKCLGYKTKSLNLSVSKTTINLVPHAEFLKPVILFNSKAKIYKTKKLKDSRLLEGAVLKSNYYIKSVIIPKTDFVDKAIVGIELPIEKHRGYSSDRKEVYKDSKLVCRIKVMERDSLGNLVLLHESPLTPIDTGEKRSLVFEFEAAPFLVEGPFEIYLENLGKIDGNYEFMNSDAFDFLRPDITEREDDYYQSVSYMQSAIGQESSVQEYNFKNHNIPGYKAGDRPYTLNYRFYYK